MTTHEHIQNWYSVRSIYRADMIEDGKPRRAFEERVVLFRAASFEEALAKGEAEARRYAADWPNPKVFDHIVAFDIHDGELCEGDEVWSCIRNSEETDDEFKHRVYRGEQYSFTNVP